MKRLAIYLTMSLMFFYNQATYALDGEGTIEEIRVCTISGSSHKNFLLYRLSDGNWFSIYGHYHNNSYIAYSGDTAAQSVIFLAYVNNFKVKVRANFNLKTRCGIPVYSQWNEEGDYIILSRDF